MGKRAPSPPPAPDPVATAAAQTASNVQTAQTQAALNNVNQYTPYGSLTYSQDPNNPLSWTATQQLSPQEQQLQNLSWAGQNLYGNTALSELGAAAGGLSQPMNTNYNNVRDQYIQSQYQLLQPQWDQQQQALQSQLANQGLSVGSPGYNNAMRDFTNQIGNTQAQILANAQSNVGQAISQTAALRQEPINEAMALLTGQQVNQPQFTQTPQTQVQPTNTYAPYQMQLQQQDLGYQAQIAQNQGMMGGVGGLVGTLGGAALLKYSDKRLKDDIRTVGTLHHAGGKIPLKTFTYRSDPTRTRRLGMVAQDIEPVAPEAVFQSPTTGMKAVDYARVLAGLKGNGNGR